MEWCWACFHDGGPLFPIAYKEHEHGHLPWDTEELSTCALGQCKCTPNIKFCYDQTEL